LLITNPKEDPEHAIGFHPSLGDAANLEDDRRYQDSLEREGFLIFFGEKFYGAKWRNFKMLLVDQVDALVDALEPVLSLGVPRFYDLYFHI
jgi:hypothetical protein